MLIIRHEQMDAFRGHMLKQFEDLMVAHLTEYYPLKCKGLGQEKLLQVIHYGIERAKKYAIDVELDVSRYICLMFTFGKDFDRNKEIPWASRILMSDDFSSGTRKMDALYEEAAKHVPESTKSP
jgi:hypothetical protein